MTIIKVEAGDIGPEHIGTIASGTIYDDDATPLFQVAGRIVAIYWMDEGVSLVLEGVPESVKIVVPYGFTIDTHQ